MIKILNSIKVLDAINRLLVESYPEYTVYVGFCPKDFDRPSFLIEITYISRQPVNCKTIQEINYFTITCFDETDDYNNSDIIRLLTVQQGVLDIFRTEHLTVDDRAIKIKASSGGMDFDQSFVDIQVEYNEDRFNTLNEILLMKEVYTKVKEE